MTLLDAYANYLGGKILWGTAWPFRVEIVFSAAVLREAMPGVARLVTRQPPAQLVTRDGWVVPVTFPEVPLGHRDPAGVIPGSALKLLRANPPTPDYPVCMIYMSKMETLYWLHLEEAG